MHFYPDLLGYQLWFFMKRGPGPRVLSVCTHCFHTMHVCWDFSIPYQCISCIYHCVWMCRVSLKCQLCNTCEERWRDRERRMIGWYHYQWYQSISIIVPHGQCIKTINISSQLRMCDVRPLQMCSCVCYPGWNLEIEWYLCCGGSCVHWRSHMKKDVNAWMHSVFMHPNFLSFLWS